MRVRAGAGRRDRAGAGLHRNQRCRRWAAAADHAKEADIRRQEATALAGWAGDLEGHLDPPGSPGFAERMREIGEAQRAVDLLVGVLGEPAAPVTVEARPRLLAAAEEAVGAIGLPRECTAIEVPSATP